MTITTTATHGFSVGQNIVIDSVALAGYNGTYTIATVPSTTKFTYTQAAGALAASGGGNAIIPSTNDPLPASVATNNPSRPRLHTWFGPMTMMMFLDAYNFWAGSTHQAQSWQLKAGVNSALDDIRNNHPNDYCGMAFFTTPANNSFYYKDPVVPIGQDFTSLKNSLFFPKSLLTTLPGNSSLELRPYSTSSFVASYGDIPNSQSSTDPVTGMALAFNILSPAPSLNTDPTRLGRRGASKVVIFETDGIPNATQTFNLTKAGYN